jgi:hypothetical protein
MAIGGIVKGLKKGGSVLDDVLDSFPQAKKLDRKFEGPSDLPDVGLPSAGPKDGVPPFSTQDEVDKALDGLFNDKSLETDSLDDILEEINVGDTPLPDFGEGKFPDFDEFASADLDEKKLNDAVDEALIELGLGPETTKTSAGLNGLIEGLSESTIQKVLPSFLEETADQVDVGLLTLEEGLLKINKQAKGGADVPFINKTMLELNKLLSVQETNSLPSQFLKETAQQVEVGLLTFEEGLGKLVQAAKKANEVDDATHEIELAQKFLFDIDDVNEHVGEDWAESINLISNAEYLPVSTISSGTEAIIKNSKGIELTPFEQADFDALTEAIEKVDLNIKGIIDEEIDLDAMVITENSPNAPFDLEKTLGLETPDYVDSLNGNQLAALKTMTHIRGRKFPEVMNKLRQDHYVGVPEGLVAQFPKRDEFLQMNEFDVAAVNFYTRSGDGPMNAALRQDKYDPNTDLGAAIDATQDALDRMPSWDPSEGFLYRRINDENLKDLFDQMEDGAEFTEKGFTSATRNEVINLATGKAKEAEILAKLNFVIKPKKGGNGKAIEGLSEFLSEQEVLFKHGTKFKLITRSETENSWGENVSIIFLEEL